jgi:hypothetical protein
MNRTPRFDWRDAVVASFGEQSKCPACKGRDGHQKVIYRSAYEARQRASQIRQARGTLLREYSCPHGYDWHLTKG